MSSGNSSSFSMPQNQEKKQVWYEVCFTNKNHPFIWLVCKTRAKILLSNSETSLTTPRLLPLRRSRRSYGNYRSPQSSGSSRNILERLGRSGRSGRSYGNQALFNNRLVTYTGDLCCAPAKQWKLWFFGSGAATRLGAGQIEIFSHVKLSGFTIHKIISLMASLLALYGGSTAMKLPYTWVNFLKKSNLA